MSLLVYEARGPKCESVYVGEDVVSWAMATVATSSIGVVGVAETEEKRLTDSNNLHDCAFIPCSKIKRWHPYLDSLDMPVCFIYSVSTSSPTDRR